jgi:hypothetical protein
MNDGAVSEATAVPTSTPIAELGTAQPTGVVQEVRELVQAALGGQADAPEPPAEAAPAKETPAVTPETEKAVSFAELAERERQLRQRERALDFRKQQEDHQRTQQPPAETAEQRNARFRADPGSFMQREFGMSLDQVAGLVAAGGDQPNSELAQLRQELTQVQQTLTSYQQNAQQAQTAYQWQQAIAGVSQGLQQAKDSYPMLIEVLGPDAAAQAIVQGTQASYNSDTFKTADDVAQELENHLTKIAERLVSAKTARAAQPKPPQQPNPTPRVTNSSTAQPTTTKRRSREEEIADAAQLLRFRDE